MSKRVIVTGAASGIGAAGVAELRRQGARVVGLDLKASGEEVLTCDVSDQASVDAAVGQAVERLGGSGLVHLAVPFAPAYCMSKRGLAAYSDSLRYEAGHEIEVTSVYPGYVRTPIHDASTEQGFSLEGLVPAEPLDKNAKAIARAVLGPPVRDLATTRMGTLSYAVARRAPRRVIDRVVMARIGRQARSGKIDDSPLAGEFARTISAGVTRRR